MHKSGLQKGESFAGRDLGVVFEWVVSETMNLYGSILKSIKNERSEGLWDGAMKNMYILGTGWGRNLQRTQKKDYQSGRIETRREGIETKEGEGFTKEGVLNNNLTMSIE